MFSDRLAVMLCRTARLGLVIIMMSAGTAGSSATMMFWMDICTLYTVSKSCDESLT